MFMVISLVMVNLYTMGWAGDGRTKDDPVTDELNMMDVLVARPIGVVAGIIGTGVLIVSLPFTIPTGSVNEAAQMFVVKPFRFSFVRNFPDDDI